MAQSLGTYLAVVLLIKELLHFPVAARATLAAISDVLNTTNAAPLAELNISMQSMFGLTKSFISFCSLTVPSQISCLNK